MWKALPLISKLLFEATSDTYTILTTDWIIYLKKSPLTFCAALLMALFIYHFDVEAIGFQFKHYHIKEPSVQESSLFNMSKRHWRGNIHVRIFYNENSNNCKKFLVKLQVLKMLDDFQEFIKIQMIYIKVYSQRDFKTN